MSSSLLFPLTLLSTSCKLFTAEAQHKVFCLLVKRTMGQEGVSPCLQTMKMLLLTQSFSVFCWVFKLVRRRVRSWCDKFLIFDEPNKQGGKCFCVFTYLGCWVDICSKLSASILFLHFLTTLQACGCSLLHLLFRYTVHLYIQVCIHTLIY